jgi:hypothetical protein
MRSSWDPSVLFTPMFDDPWLALALGPLLYLSVASAIVVHEAGHAAAVALVRARLVSVEVGSGPVLARRTSSRTTVTVAAWPNRGLTVYLLDGADRVGARTTPILLAGSIVNVVATLVLSVTVAGRQADNLVWVVSWLAAAQLWVGVANLIPWRTRDMASDGWLLGLMVIRHRRWLLRSLAVQAVLGAATWGQQTSCTTSEGRPHLDRLLELDPSLTETTALLPPAGRIGLAYALLTQHHYGEALRLLPDETVEVPRSPAMAGLRDNYFAVATMSIIEAEGGSSAARARADEIPAVRRALLRSGLHHRGTVPHAISLGMFALVEGHPLRASWVLDGHQTEPTPAHTAAMGLCARAGLARALGDDAGAAELLARARQLAPGCPRPDVVEICRWAPA